MGLEKHTLQKKIVTFFNSFDVLYTIPCMIWSTGNGGGVVKGRGRKLWSLLYSTVGKWHKIKAKMPRHRGLGEECTTFFRKGARSNPFANFEERKREKPAREKIDRKNWKQKNEKKRHARERPVTGKRARTRKRLDPKLTKRGKKRLDSKDVKCELNDR